MRSFHISSVLLSENSNAEAIKHRITTLRNTNINKIKVFFDLFFLFSDLPLGLSPETSRTLKERFSHIQQPPKQTFSNLLEFTRQLRQHTEHYKCKKACHQELNKKSFWRSLPNNIQHQKNKWRMVKYFSYYSSSDIGYLAFNTLPYIENYTLQAKKQLQGVSPKKRTETINLFKNFIADTRKQLRKQQKNIAKAMQARLEIAAKHFDISYDNVLLDFIETLSKEKSARIIKPKNLNHQSSRLSKKDFLRFHQYIDRHGNEKTKLALSRLPWIRDKVYYKDKSHRWVFPPHSAIHSIWIPKKLRKPKWLFKGRNARYKAFNDPYHHVAIYIQSQQAKMLCTQNQTTLTSDTPAKLQRTYHIIRIEQERLLALEKTLNRFFHAKTLKILGAQIQTHTRQLREILVAQCDLLENVVRFRNTQPTENAFIHAKHLLKTLNKIDKSRFPNIEKKLLILSNKIKQRSDEHFHEIIPVQYRIAEEIARYIANKSPSIPSLALALDAFDFQLFERSTINILLKTIHTLLQDNSTFLRTIEQDQLLKHLHNIFSDQSTKESRLFIKNFIQEQANLDLAATPPLVQNLAHPSLPESRTNLSALNISTVFLQNQTPAVELMNSHPPQKTKPSQEESEHLFISAIENNKLRTMHYQDPKGLSRKLKIHLRKLLDPDHEDEKHMEKLEHFKNAVLSLPDSYWNQPIKRLCSAGIQINNIINELPESIIALATGETHQIPQLNALLVDIIAANLIEKESKNTIIKLLNITTTNENPYYDKLHTRLKVALRSLKKLFIGIGTNKDRKNIARYTLHYEALNSPRPFTL